MKKAYIINENGFYIEDYIYEEGQELESDIVTIDIQQGLYKPKWNGTRWVEGATQEYIDSMNPTIVQEPTIEERLASAEEMLTMLMGGVEYELYFKSMDIAKI